MKMNTVNVAKIDLIAIILMRIYDNITIFLIIKEAIRVWATFSSRISVSFSCSFPFVYRTLLHFSKTLTILMNIFLEMNIF